MRALVLVRPRRGKVRPTLSDSANPWATSFQWRRALLRSHHSHFWRHPSHVALVSGFPLPLLAWNGLHVLSSRSVHHSRGAAARRPFVHSRATFRPWRRHCCWRPVWPLLAAALCTSCARRCRLGGVGILAFAATFHVLEILPRLRLATLVQ